MAMRKEYIAFVQWVYLFLKKNKQTPAYKQLILVNKLD